MTRRNLRPRVGWNIRTYGCHGTAGCCCFSLGHGVVECRAEVVAEQLALKVTVEQTPMKLFDGEIHLKELVGRLVGILGCSQNMVRKGLVRLG